MIVVFKRRLHERYKYFTKLYMGIITNEVCVTLLISVHVHVYYFAANYTGK